MGLALHITNKQEFQPVTLGIEIQTLLIKMYPASCKELLYKTNANPNGDGHLDKLLGIQHSFKIIKNGGSIQTQIRKEQWQDIVEPYLFY